MIVLVCGGRRFEDKSAVFNTLDLSHSLIPITLIVSGGATGADTLAIEWAEQNNVDFVVMEPEWEFGGYAGNARNAKMLRLTNPNLVLAFPGGSGTRDMVERALSAGVWTITSGWKMIQQKPAAYQDA